MYYEEKQIPELLFLKHRHDSEQPFVDYEKMILDKSLTPYLFNNERMNYFLTNLQRPISIFFDNVNIVKNFKNYLVDKYYYKHPS
jgi:hypothetical protein